MREKGKWAELRPTRGRSKQERVEEQLHLFADGCVYVAGDQPWTTALVDEVLRFPHGRHDDQVDALTQYLAWFAEKGRVHTPVTMSTTSSDLLAFRAMSGVTTPRGVHPMRNPKAPGRFR